MALDRVEEIKAEIQCLGVRVCSSEDLCRRIRKGGAGPAEGITVLVNGSPASVPFSSRFVSDSPFLLARKGGRWVLHHRETRLDSVRVSFLPEPLFYREQTPEGIPFRKIALFHGSDCLASTVLQTCTYWGTGQGCRFCGIGLSWKTGTTVLQKEAGQLARVALAAKQEGVRHVTLTSGSTGDRMLEEQLFRDSSRAITEATGLPVHVQLMPPFSRAQLERLRDAGVASLGIHRESFDNGLLSSIAPCKASIPLDAFLQAWRDGVEVFGRGQVSSYLLMGLGETEQSLKEGCSRLADLGVYPFLVPFRPIPGTTLAFRKPMDPQAAKEIYWQAALILEEHELHWSSVKAGCVRCRGCSALPDFQNALDRQRRSQAQNGKIAWEVFRSGPYLASAYAIRHEVFVEEQGLFQETDRDGWEEDSIHIVARMDNRCLGTVRMTPLGDSNWLGSRLAVKKNHRGRLGFRLVRKAEEEVIKRGAKRFVAYIQLSRVDFFTQCGWRCVSEVPDYHGKPHMLMMAAGPLWKKINTDSPGAGNISSQRLFPSACQKI